MIKKLVLFLAVFAFAGVCRAQSGHAVTLTWQAPAPNGDTNPVVGYDVFRMLNGGLAFEQINTATDTSTTYKDATVTGAMTYQYYVVSVDSAGNRSTLSNVVTATIPADLAPPFNFIGTAGL